MQRAKALTWDHRNRVCRLTFRPIPALLRPRRTFLVFALIAFAVVASSCTSTPKTSTPSVLKADLESAHGVKLVPSARNFQQVRQGGLMNRGVVSLFEMDQAEISTFLSQLKIKSRNWPASPGPGNPCVNGQNVWPATAATVVPARKGLDGLERTWTGSASPIEMLSCASTTGDWLQVEIWAVSDHTLIKLYTEGN